MRRALVLAALATALAVPAPLGASDEPAVQVSVDKPRPAADEMVRLTYTFTGSGLSGASQVPPIPLKNLAIAGGPFRSDQVSFVNGVFSRTLSITWMLRPIGPGPAEIGEVAFGFGDKTVKAPSYLLDVGPPRPAGAAQRPQPQESEPEDPLAQFFRRREEMMEPPRRPRRAGRSSSSGSPPTRRRPTSARRSRWTYELLTQADVQGLEYLEPPKFPGLWAEDLEKPDPPRGPARRRGRPTVMRFTLLKKVVSGLTPGTVNGAGVEDPDERAHRSGPGR